MIRHDYVAFVSIGLEEYEILHFRKHLKTNSVVTLIIMYVGKIRILMFNLISVLKSLQILTLISTVLLVYIC